MDDCYPLVRYVNRKKVERTLKMCSFSVLSSPQDEDACQTFEIRLTRLSEGSYSGNIKLKKKLDYEFRSSYNIPLIASDQGAETRRTSEISVLVEVEDLQDQPPVFKHAPYSVIVPENLPPVRRTSTLFSKFFCNRHDAFLTVGAFGEWTS